MPVTVKVGGQLFTVNSTDDPEIARKKARRELRKRTGDYSALGETFVKGPIYGITTGLIQGPVELATTAYDLVKGTDYTSDVTDYFEKVKIEKPISTAGNISSALFQFGAPASIATRMARKSLLRPKTGKLFDQRSKYVTKPTFIKHTVAPVAAADFVATTADTPELGIVKGMYDKMDPNFFGPSNPQNEINLLDEKINASNRIAQRFRVGAEGALIMLGLPALWKGLKAAGAGAAKVAGQSESAMSAARWMQDKKNNLRNIMDEGQMRGDKLYKTLSKFRPQGAFTTVEAAEAKAAKTAAVNKELTQLENNLGNLWGGFKWLNKSGKMSKDELVDVADNIRRATYGVKKEVRDEAAENLKRIDEQYMTKKNWFKTVTEDVNPKTKEITWKEEISPKFSFSKNAQRTRTQIDSLSKELLKNKQYLPGGYAEAIEANLERYGYQAYRAFIDNVDHVVPYNSAKWKSAREELIKNQVVKLTTQEISNIKPEQVQKLLEEKADVVLRDLLKKRNFDNAFMVPEMSLDGVKVGLLKDKTLQNLPELRRFLGQITGKKGDATERIAEFQMQTTATIENLAKMTSSMRYLDDVADINQRLIGQNSNKRFLYDNIDDVPENIRAGFLDEFGMPVTIPDELRFGPIAGKITTQGMADALIGSQRGWLEQAPGVMGKAWAGFLGSKGLIQKFKTVYSPITQVRNATSAALFAVMNGNVASGKTLQDSMMIVFDMLKKTQGTNMSSYYANAQKKGVVQSGAKIGEIDSLLDDAVKTMGIGENKGIFSRAYKAQKNDLFTRLYVGSDDLWKIASWEMEKGRLLRGFDNAVAKNADFVMPSSYYRDLSPKVFREVEKAGGKWNNLSPKLKNEVIEEMGAGIVRNTVPNYSKVPEFIQSLRRTPFGNFIAFPAETIRTSVASTSRAIDEIASGVPELAEIGMRRLMGNMAVMYGIPKATYEFGKYMTGADDEQVQAYKRSFAAPWEKNADLVPMRTDKDGNIVEFFNYSYTNPYEYLRGPINAVFNAVQNGETRGDKLNEILMQGIVGTRDNPGAIIEYLEPFVGASIATNIGLDLARNTTYASGSAQRIWNSTDDAGLVSQKILAHVVNSAAPPILPATIKPGRPGDMGPLFWKDLPRATLNTLGLANTPLNSKGIRPNTYGQIAESFTGLKTIKPTIERTLGFRALDAKEQMREAVSYYTAAVSNPNILNPEEHVKALMKTNEARFEAVKDLSMAIEDAKSLGASENEIYEVLKEKKISKPEAIMNHTFVPYYPSAYQIERELQKEGAKFPEEELRQSFIEEIRPTLPNVGAPTFTAPAQPGRRLTAFDKARRDPEGSAAVLLRQKELEKLMGI